MIKNYLKIIYRNLIKNKSYSLISISSLTIGLAVCIMLLLYVQHELSYDRYHEEADNIYRLCQLEHPYHAPQAAKALADNVPEIKTYARILPQYDFIVEYKENKFKENKVAFIDNELFKIFSFKFKKGMQETALKEPATIVISEETAKKYFGSENALGKVLKIGNERNYTITGILEDIPKNSHFRYDIFVTLSDADIVFGEEWMNHWGWMNFLVYFQMQDKFSKPDVEVKICELMKNPHDPEAQLPKLSLQNLKDIHLYSEHIENDMQAQNSITYVLIFSGIGVLILLIACFNYILLLTANFTTRVKEIGIRKVYGAFRKQVASQFLSESIVVFLISLLLSLLLVRLCLPIFNELSGKILSFSELFNINIVMGIFGIMFFVCLLAGWYPAFYLSSIKPAKVFKSSKNAGDSKFHIRKILVGAQFVIVIALIACAGIMLRQIKFLQNKELGFDKEQVLVSVVDDFVSENKYNTLKNALLDNSIVSSVSSASRVPSDPLSDIGGLIPNRQTQWVEIPYVHTNFDYFGTLGIKASQGRLFSNKYKTDSTESVILNESAVKSMGIQGNPIGQKVKCNWPESDRKIVGVVEDFNFESLYKKVKPAVFVIDFEQNSQIMVRIKQGSTLETMNSINEICKKIYPDQIFDFQFLDTRLNNIYQSDQRTFQLMSYFSVLAIILACMGLLGMASFMLKGRTKEIGIRKVNGATLSEIMKMLNKDFVKWVCIAFVIATPLVFYIMSKWLESFAYKISLSWWLFALSGIVTLIIVILTISWLTFNTARRNPVEALRYE